ncbi:MAG: N-acetylmuramoyl-L-alanine amidase-like domain-containing protein [Gemmatimonadales bacterium]
MPVDSTLSRRELLRQAAAAAAALTFPAPLLACRGKSRLPGRGRADTDQERLLSWTNLLRTEGLTEAQLPLGARVGRVGELAGGSPYVPFTLEAYLEHGGVPSAEPLTLSLTRFDCVTLVEACLAVSRVAATKQPASWEQFGREVERMRYREGKRQGYSSRLHYFSEWISDGERRGLVKDMGPELGAAEDTRPLRFMTQHRAKYLALQDVPVFQEIQRIERGLDGRPRHVVPTKQIPAIVDRIQTGDVLAFATEIPGLDVTHSALAYRDRDRVLRVCHAPLSGGVVAITRATLPEYVAAIRGASGILVARPLRG